MDSRQVGTQFRHQLRIAFSTQLTGEPVAGRDAGHPLHDEKCAAVHRGVIAQPEWPRHLDAGLVDCAQHSEFLSAAQAPLHHRLRVAAQHPALASGMGAALHVDVEQPVLLYSTARQALLMLNADSLRASLAAKEGFKPVFL
ncbi:hypothetical protein D3C84_921380 [compost metagenome]